MLLAARWCAAQAAAMQEPHPAVRFLVADDTPRLVGLISELLPDQATLLARAEELATIVAGHAPITMQVTKEALRRLQVRLGDENIDDLVRLAYGSADFREGMAAFLGKRAPKWSGA